MVYKSSNERLQELQDEDEREWIKMVTGSYPEQKSTPKKRGRPVKPKTTNIMKARSDMTKTGNKIDIETEFNIKAGIDPKIKKALKENILEALNGKMKGGSIMSVSKVKERVSEFRDKMMANTPMGRVSV